MPASERYSPDRIRAGKLTGNELKLIRQRCGYSAQDFAAYLKAKGSRITSERSVYRLEERYLVPFRYVGALCALVGKKYFDVCVEELARQMEERNETYER